MKLDYAPSPNREAAAQTYQLDRALTRAFAEACRRDGRKRSTVVEALIRLYLESESGGDK